MRPYTNAPRLRHAQRGSMLVEAVVSIGIALLTLVGAMTTFSYLYRSAVTNVANVRAAFLAEEGLEAVRVIRDNAWSTVAGQTSGAQSHVYFDGSTWLATTTNTYIDKTFERTIVYTNVYRDANKKIAQTGTLDTNIKKITVSVSWSSHGATSTRTLATYLANTYNE